MVIGRPYLAPRLNWCRNPANKLRCAELFECPHGPSMSLSKKFMAHILTDTSTGYDAGVSSPMAS
jgi:hypothetical protein